MMRSHMASLSYRARQEVLAQIIPRYHEATPAQKTLFLDRLVEVTGYARKYAITLLNRVPESRAIILRLRQPTYGPEVQHALFLAWQTTRYVCAKRLVPFLPSLIPSLEQHGRLRLSENHRRLLLAMSVKTAERLLHTQRKPTPHGLSTTQAGLLLKHQIPIRTFSAWNEIQPGFVEADLVAHCGGHSEGGYLYTFTLTDIATGWTECLPLLNRSPETVLAAFQQACVLFPFPIRGLDTDNGGEFINEVLVTYCAQQQITFTRGRPEYHNDNCYIEQKNRAIVRQTIGYDRLVSEAAYQQLGEFYQALRLSVNCFQPSMKLQSKRHEEGKVRRVYDTAKTPLQRLLLSGILPEQRQQELRESVQALDPLGLVRHLEDLQHAVWRCAGDPPGASLVRFSRDMCSSASLPRREPPEPLPQASPSLAETRDWSRSMDDPFLGEWEQIHAFVRAHPMASGGEILREWQRRFPERFVEAHLSLLQRRLREMRASLVASQTVAPETHASRTMPQPAQAVASLTDTPTVIFVDPASASPSLLPHPEEETRPARRPKGAASDASSSKMDVKDQHAPPAQLLPVASVGETLSPATMTFDHAITLFLQGKHTENWEPKTREWYETSLGQLLRYVTWRKILLLSSLTSSEIRGWLTFLRTEALVTGTFRVQSTIATYARSAHAWCAWLVAQGHLEQSPFAGMPFPQGKERPLRVLDQKIFERYLEACHAPSTKRTTMAFATARNQAILWVLWDTGLLVSETCALNLEDVDLRQGTLHVQGTGSKERTLPLTPATQQALTGYLASYRWRAGKQEASDPLFLSEQRARLTENVFTQLFRRLRARAGLEGRLTPTMLRDMFAVRFLQTGGLPKALQRLLGLAESTSIKRYLDAAGVARKSSPRVRNHPQT